ncbi:MAG TPA: hypothetical protein VMU06_16795 [Stellaceae bacterium]|nr:hypothetical protein [Stellaceae bacterium]
MKNIAMGATLAALTLAFFISGPSDARAEGDFCLGGWTLVPGLKSMYVRDVEGNFVLTLVATGRWVCFWDG